MCLGSLVTGILLGMGLMCMVKCCRKVFGTRKRRRCKKECCRRSCCEKDTCKVKKSCCPSQNRCTKRSCELNKPDCVLCRKEAEACCRNNYCREEECNRPGNCLPRSRKSRCSNRDDDNGKWERRKCGITWGHRGGPDKNDGGCGYRPFTSSRRPVREAEGSRGWWQLGGYDEGGSCSYKPFTSSRRRHQPYGYLKEGGSRSQRSATQRRGWFADNNQRYYRLISSEDGTFGVDGGGDGEQLLALHHLNSNVLLDNETVDY